MALVLNKETLKAEVIGRPDHSISRENISKAALKVLYRLHRAGYHAYLVGGSVRDILLNKQPKDFDVVTDATPEQVRKLFSNSMIIGRRFRLVHVRYGHDIIEVATFRGELEQEKHVSQETGMILRDNVYGDIRDDVLRRDFTVNALYYNIADFSVVDYVTGMQDVKARTLRVLGEPELRYREDPVRMLRAVRLAAKLDFTIEPASASAIVALKEQVLHVPPARVFDEMVKMSMSGASVAVYQLLDEFQLFELLYPLVHETIQSDDTGRYKQLLDIALQESDARIAIGKTINPAFLIAVLYWGPLQSYLQAEMAEGKKLYPAMAIAESEVFKQMAPLVIPKRLLLIVREIWTMQFQLTQTRRNRIFRCLYHPRFRAAYDFLLIRERSGESELSDLCQFWTVIQESEQDEQEHLIAEHQQRFGVGKIGRSRRRTRRKKPS